MDINLLNTVVKRKGNRRVGMDQNILNLVILIFGGVISLIQSLAKSGNKRITKLSNSLLTFLQFAVFLYGLNIIVPNPTLGYVAIAVYILGFIVFSYIRGAVYSVRTQDKALLLKLTGDALREIEFTKAEDYAEDKSIIYKIPDTPRIVEVTEKESTFNTSKLTYTIKFKKWLNFDSRKEILRYIDEGLQSEELPKSKKLKVIGEITLAVLLLCFAIGMMTSAVIEPKDLRNILQNETPEALYIENSSRVIKYEASLSELHKVIANGYSAKASTKDTPVEGRAIYGALSYKDNKMVVYIMENSYSMTAYAYVDYLYMAEKSLLHKLSFKIQRIYNKKEGTYYYIFLEKDTITSVMKKIDENY